MEIYHDISISKPKGWSDPPFYFTDGFGAKIPFAWGCLEKHTRRVDKGFCLISKSAYFPQKALVG